MELHDTIGKEHSRDINDNITKGKILPSERRRLKVHVKQTERLLQLVAIHKLVYQDSNTG
jgi:hypothetical protein